MDKIISDLACRVCLNVEELMVHIYEEVEDLNSDLSTLLEQCGDLKVDRSDSFPKYLCKECTSELLIAAKFREKCSRTKEILQNYQAELSSLGDGLTALVDESELGVCVSEPLVSGGIIEQYDAAIINEPLELEQDYIKLPALDIKTEQTLLMPIGYFSTASKHQRNTNSLLNEPPATINKCLRFGAENSVNNKDSHHTEEIIVFDESELDAHIIDLAEAEANAAEIAAQDVSTNNDEEMQSKSINMNLKFICDICGAAFTNATNLHRHVNASHVPLELYNCVRCRHCFSMEEKFKEHCKLCMDVKTAALSSMPAINVDSICSAAKAKQRVRRKTQSTSADSKICTYCQKDCKTFFALNMHLRTHTGERPFSCDLCLKTFKTRSTLTAHLKRHAGQPDYVCSYCSKTFYESTNLQAHIRTHTGEKPHACTLCDKRFTRVFLLQLHMRTHTGEKPYPCPLCARSFAQLCDMKNHIRTHTGDRQFQCEYCPKSFIKRRQMLMHMQRHAALEVTHNQQPDVLQVQTPNSTIILEVSEDCGETSIEYNLNDLIVEDDT